MAMCMGPALRLSDEMGVDTSFLKQLSFGNLSPHQDPREDIRVPETTGCKTERSANILRARKEKDYICTWVFQTSPSPSKMYLSPTLWWLVSPNHWLILILWSAAWGLIKYATVSLDNRILLWIIGTFLPQGALGSPTQGQLSMCRQPRGLVRLSLQPEQRVFLECRALIWCRRRMWRFCRAGGRIDDWLSSSRNSLVFLVFLFLSLK